jgi:hypothetical protein
MKHNPKHIQAQKEGKTPFEYLIYEVLAGDAEVHKSGADKYGVRNWRQDEILASTYEGAILRHFTAWAQGQDLDPDSGASHLYHIRACCAIILDADMRGTLIDDRDRVESKEPVQERSGKDRRISEPHVPTTAEKIDMDRAVKQYMVQFSGAKRNSTRGPFDSLAEASSYAARNPEKLQGITKITPSH